MQRMLKATNVVLILLCAMYFISYIVRQSIATQMLEIRPEFGLTATDAGFIFSAFAYPYLLFQIIGGLTADKFGPRKTLFISGLVWAGATILTGLATGLTSLFLWRVLMGFGVGATLPPRRAPCSMGSRPAAAASRRHHAFVLAVGNSSPRSCGGDHGDRRLARPFVVSASRAFSGDRVVLVFPRRSEGSSLITQKSSTSCLEGRQPTRAVVPWGPLIAACGVTLTYFCYGCASGSISRSCRSSSRTGSCCPTRTRAVRFRRLFRGAIGTRSRLISDRCSPGAAMSLARSRSRSSALRRAAVAAPRDVYRRLMRMAFCLAAASSSPRWLRRCGRSDGHRAEIFRHGVGLMNQLRLARPLAWWRDPGRATGAGSCVMVAIGC